jgi:hypothetical protein
MIVNAVQCKDCLSVIFSRAVHDFRWCTCKGIAIDGGRQYEKLVGEPDTMMRLKLEVLATEKQLYDDWNLRRDKWGLHDCIEASTGIIKTSKKPLTRKDVVNVKKKKIRKNAP